MKWSKWLENWDMTSLKIKAPFLEMEWNPSEPDKVAAWRLYVELLTQYDSSTCSKDGDEKTALDSVYSLFPTTRSIIRTTGAGAWNLRRSLWLFSIRRYDHSLQNGTGGHSVAILMTPRSVSNLERSWMGYR